MIEPLLITRVMAVADVLFFSLSLLNIYTVLYKNCHVVLTRILPQEFVIMMDHFLPREQKGNTHTDETVQHVKKRRTKHKK